MSCHADNKNVALACRILEEINVTNAKHVMRKTLMQYQQKLYVRVTVHRNKFLYNKTNKMH